MLSTYISEDISNLIQRNIDFLTNYHVLKRPLHKEYFAFVYVCPNRHTLRVKTKYTDGSMFVNWYDTNQPWTARRIVDNFVHAPNGSTMVPRRYCFSSADDKLIKNRHFSYTDILKLI